MHSFYFNVKTWSEDIGLLPAIQELFLFRIVQKQVVLAAEIPYDAETFKKLCRQIGAVSEEEKVIVKDLLEEFFEKTELGYVHPQCEKVIAIQKLNQSKRNLSASNRGKLGGRPKKLLGEKQEDYSCVNVEQKGGVNPYESICYKRDDSNVIENEEKKLNKKLNLFPHKESTTYDINKKYINNKNKNNKTHTTNPHNYPEASTAFFKPGYNCDFDFNFLKFIEIYPKGVDQWKKEKAAMEWRLGGHSMHCGAIIKNIQDRVEVSDWKSMIGTDKEKFIPDPATFLRNKQYFCPVEKKFLTAEEQKEKDMEFIHECIEGGWVVLDEEVGHGSNTIQ